MAILVAWEVMPAGWKIRVMVTWVALPAGVVPVVTVVRALSLLVVTAALSMTVLLKAGLAATEVAVMGPVITVVAAPVARVVLAVLVAPVYWSQVERCR